MKRIAIDSMIVDKIMDSSGLLELIQAANAQGKMIFVTTHILKDQLAAAATRDAGRAARLLATYEALPKRIVPTHGAVWGVSRFGGATWGDGADSGVSIDDVKTSGRGAMQDALIATTASGQADVLVTDERDLPKKVRQAGAKCDVWNWEQLAPIRK